MSDQNVWLLCAKNLTTKLLGLGMTYWPSFVSEAFLLSGDTAELCRISSGECLLVLLRALGGMRYDVGIGPGRDLH